MTAKQALMELIPELSEDDAQRLLEYAQDFYDDEPLSDEEREDRSKSGPRRKLAMRCPGRT